MPPVHALIAAAMLLTAAPLAYSQETREVEGPESIAPPGARVAIPRDAAPSPASRTEAPPRRAPAPQAGPARQALPAPQSGPVAQAGPIYQRRPDVPGE